MLNLGMVEHICNTGTWETWILDWHIYGQSMLHIKMTKIKQPQVKKEAVCALHKSHEITQISVPARNLLNGCSK